MLQSTYNKNTKKQQDYYIDQKKCDIGDKAYLFSHENKKMTEMTIVHIISRNENPKYYDNLITTADVLKTGETTYNANTSAEFIADDNCYLVWFSYPQTKRLHISMAYTFVGDTGIDVPLELLKGKSDEEQLEIAYEYAQDNIDTIPVADNAEYIGNSDTFEMEDISWEE